MVTFVVACGNSTEVFQPVDSAFDDIAPFLVSRLIETWRRSTSMPFVQSFFLLIAAFGTNTMHAAVLDLLSIIACTIVTVYT